jgi:broad specificity phosphatase PhoE
VLILVRHGRTAANAAHLWQGRLDLPLDDHGHAQAATLPAAVGPVDVLISSPLQRARLTAAYLGSAVQLDERWIELDYGTLDGKPVAELAQQEWERWRADRHFNPGGGETMAELADRVRPACEELCALAEDRNVVVVSHVSPIKAAVMWALDVGIEHVFGTFLEQASITRLALSPARRVLWSFNEHGHLAALLRTGPGA